MLKIEASPEFHLEDQKTPINPNHDLGYKMELDGQCPLICACDVNQLKVLRQKNITISIKMKQRQNSETKKK